MLFLFVKITVNCRGSSVCIKDEQSLSKLIISELSEIGQFCFEWSDPKTFANKLLNELLALLVSDVR